MTTWFPISFTVPQYEDSAGVPYSGAVLKAYAAGTSTPILMATDFTGGTTVGSIALNADGFPVVSSNVVIPHVSENMKLALYPTQAAADTDTGAIWNPDNIQVAQNANAERYVNYIAETGAANAYVIAPDPAITAYAVGQVVTLIPTNNNTGASTIIVNGLAAKGIKRTDGTDVVANDLLKTGVYQLIYNGTAFIVQDPTTPEIVKDVTPQLGGDLDSNGNQIQWSKGADVASDTVLPIITDGNYFDVTGTTTVTSIDTTGKIGTVIKLHFDDVLILTHNAADLILPTGANITTAAGDEIELIEYASGDFRVTNYMKASGQPLVTADVVKIGTLTASASASLDFTSMIDDTLYSAYNIVFEDLLASSGGVLAMRYSADNGSTWVSGANTYESSVNTTNITGTTDTTWSMTADIVKTYIKISNTSISATFAASGIITIQGTTPNAGVGVANTNMATWNTNEGSNSATGAGRTDDSATFTSGVNIDAIQLFIAGGPTITTGTFTMYGVKK